MNTRSKILFLILVPTALLFAALSIFAFLFIQAVACDSPAALTSECTRIGLSFTAPMAIVGILFPVIGMVGLWRQKEYGQIFIAITAVLFLLFFPIGTVVGGIILYLLFSKEETDEEEDSSAEILEETTEDPAE